MHLSLASNFAGTCVRVVPFRQLGKGNLELGCDPTDPIMDLCMEYRGFGWAEDWAALALRRGQGGDVYYWGIMDHLLRICLGPLLSPELHRPYTCTWLLNICK